MVSTCFYFQVHQPYRLKKFSIFEIGQNVNYFESTNLTKYNNQELIKKVSNKCYLPTNKLMLNLLQEYPELKLSYSFSGTVLDQFEEYYPEALLSFQELTDTKRVEILSETYYHSLAFIYSKKEFAEQIILHKNKIKRLFNQTPQVFRNTELIYNNELAKTIEDLGYKGILAEGADHILDWRSPNFVYKPTTTENIKLLLKNYKLSDDIAFRFSERSWKEWPLTSEKYAKWINAINGNGNVVNLFMDYETFGEHQWESTGIFDFLKHLPKEILKHPDNDFKTPSEVIKSYKPAAELDIHNLISWADIERDLSAWTGNQMQKTALNEVYKIESQILKTKNKDIIDQWRRLQTSDHFYYMCTKWFADGDVHKYFNPYESPYEAFITFINVLNDLKLKINTLEVKKL
ncbi:MAG: glycoside hydrolase family 57 protein [Nanoarchaeota archaeon]|nr:glycoside hydrolase family 57 protein [Nanoarchaeota archaeon]